MCMSSPKIPPPPPPPQAVKQPDAAGLNDSARKNRTGAMTGGSLLTGPAGLTGVTTGKATLLGQ